MTTPRFITAATYKVYLPSAPVQSYTIAAPVYHLSLDGIATPSVVRQFQPYPNGDGGVDKGFRLQPRQLVWRLFVDASSETELESKRTELYRAFRASEQALQLEVTKAGGGQRTLDVHVSGPIEFRESGQVGYSCEVAIPLYAPEPAWYYSVRNSQLFNLATATAGSVAVDYIGNWFEYPVLELANGFANLKLTDIAGTTIDFTGHTFGVGTTYTIDLRPGAKTAVDNTGTDISANIVSTNWGSFGLYPGPLTGSSGTLTLNLNTINATYTSKNVGSAITIRWYDRYLNL